MLKDERGIPRLAYAQKVNPLKCRTLQVTEDLLAIGKSRQFLHHAVYQHKTVLIIEHL